MKDFLAIFGEFITVIAVSGMLYQVIPEGSQKKYIQFAISLAVLTALIGPMISVVSSLPDTLRDVSLRTEDVETVVGEDLSDQLIEESTANIERSVVSLLSGRFDIAAEDLAVLAEVDASDPENIVIRRITVDVCGASAAQKREMETYLRSLFLEQSEIVIREGKRS